jgi:hypothetical protein
VGSSTIAVRPLTRLSLAEIRSESDSETLKVDLQAGRVRVEVKPPAGTRANMSVQSPSATASVRGTDFEFDARNLKVYEGTVVLRGNDDIVEVLIPAGRTSYVDGHSRAIDPVEASRHSLEPPAPVGTGSSGRPSGTTSPAEPPTTGTIKVTIEGGYL